jgi:hypothetical protein
MKKCQALAYSHSVYGNGGAAARAEVNAELVGQRVGT